ncbi:uncharacterized protein LOC115344579 [Aquila chrysaetos chrysaetos]|uniref:uncharacterized protein LOC115344579 n=1 Tax=Aquila chrysaetos chrysaetos TaxID=223781 RepID=UPI0011771094|nr:uncharacterized protein LOC115344579 [Aquila chrysaetos chrysaetos]XP_040981264.1 uncharacterized protein LOC115344579 [Aquila chrysaetos chrysaetos]
MRNLAAPGTGVGEVGRGVRKRKCEYTVRSSAGNSEKQTLREEKWTLRARPGMPWQRDNRELTSTPIGVPWGTPPAIRVWMMLLWYLLVGHTVSGNVSHQPFKWSLIQLEHSVVIQTRITPGAPSFTAHLSSLIRSYHGWAPIDENTRKYTVQHKAFYMCPANNPGKEYCNHPAEYYCAYWGCETIASEWAPGGGKDQFLTVGWGPSGCQKPTYGPQGTIRGGTCWHIYLNISKPEDLGWTIGRTWGIRFWEPGTDTGGIILIRKEPVPNEPSGVGPNPVYNGQATGGVRKMKKRLGNTTELV